MANKRALNGADLPSRVVIARLIQLLRCGLADKALAELEASPTGRVIASLLEGSHTIQELSKKLGVGYRTIYRVVDACKEAKYSVRQTKDGKWSIQT